MGNKRYAGLLLYRIERAIDYENPKYIDLDEERWSVMDHRLSAAEAWPQIQRVAVEVRFWTDDTSPEETKHNQYNDAHMPERMKSYRPLYWSEQCGPPLSREQTRCHLTELHFP